MNKFKSYKNWLNEKFSDESDPIEDMDIGTRAQIKKWFESIDLSPDEFTIDDDLKITVGENLNLAYTAITQLPDNLTVGGSLDLEGTAITQLPDNLTVGGYLDLQGTAITQLPKTLKVKGKIYKDF